jgi:phosphatidylinositol alpha-mannosyltransferase
MPTNGSVGTLTFSPRYISQVRELLARERFDLLHFHEPFVPFLSLFLLRESRSVNVATFHAYAGFSPSYELGGRLMRGSASRLHGRIAVSAAARHFIDRFFPGDCALPPRAIAIHLPPTRCVTAATAPRGCKPCSLIWLRVILWVAYRTYTSHKHE